MEKFKVIIVEDDKLELKGTQQILQTEVPEAEIIGTASGESDFWKLMRDGQPDLVLLDLGLGGSTTNAFGSKCSARALTASSSRRATSCSEMTLCRLCTAATSSSTSRSSRK